METGKGSYFTIDTVSLQKAGYKLIATETKTKSQQEKSTTATETYVVFYVEEIGSNTTAIFNIYEAGVLTTNRIDEAGSDTFGSPVLESGTVELSQ